MSSTVLMKWDWPRIKFILFGFSMATVEISMGSLLEKKWLKIKKTLICWY
jgi:hypothetical protein